MRPRHYILRNRTPVAVDLMTWAEWFEDFSKRRVALDRIERIDADPVEVSTVFLGLDHSWSDQGPPILFESMVFGGPLDGEQHRYATWAEAEIGHRHLLAESVTEGELVAWQTRQALARF